MNSQPQTPSYLLNRDLFSNHYLIEHLPETDDWTDITEAELRGARAELKSLWEQVESRAPQLNEAALEANFIRPAFEKLGIPFEVEQSVQQGRRRPDYAFFESNDAIGEAHDLAEEGGNFYRDAIAIADAKRWDRALDTRGAKKEDYENPSYQIDQYLRKTETTWAVLTNGKKWRLYYKPTSHRLDSYYEIDLIDIIENGDLNDFRYFYLFFRHNAFIPGKSGECFLDRVQSESNTFAQALGEDLQNNIYEAIKILAEGFLQYHENDLNEDDLNLIHDSSLIYLYRLIFVLYAEAEGRELLDTDNEYYKERYSLNALKQDVAKGLDSADTHYPEWDNELWIHTNKLFKLIDQGSKARNIPEDELYVPAYNGGLFRTDPAKTDDPEALFLAENMVSDAYLAEVINLLTRSENGAGGGKTFVDYSSLDIRHLGGIYEGLLEYQLNIADEPLTVEDGQYKSAEEGDSIEVETGEVYLTTDSGERKATGSYYTPEYIVEYIIENTLGPLVEEIREELLASDSDDDAGFAEEFADRIFELKVLDPAMGSGHFLTSAVNYLAREIIQAQERQAEQQGIETVDEERDIYWARRQVAQRCIYGVDINPLAVELAKVSLWLRTLAAEQPLAFLDHHLKTGNSLVGSDIDEVLANGESSTDDHQLTLQQSFDRTRKQALEHVTDRFAELLSIDNETLDDIKEMEDVYREVRQDPLYQNLQAMANVHTAEDFGMDVPDEAYVKMAEALRDDTWEEKVSSEWDNWFQPAQELAEDQEFFHWQLEFPIAFYEQGGDRSTDAGFDAVIGNPPYVRIYRDKLPSELVDYLKQKYETAYMKFDLYVVFSELGIELTTDGGYFSYIIPDKFTSTPYGEPLRNLILEQTVIKSFLDLSDRKVFDDATVSNLIPVLKKSDSSTSQIDVRKFSHDNQVISTFKPIEAIITKGASKFRLSRSLDDVNLMSKVEEQSIAFNDIFYVNWGLRTGTVEKTNKYVVENDDHPDAKPMIRGGDIIDSYHLKPPSEYVIYNKDDFYNPMFEELFENPKIVFRKISGRGLMAVAEEENYYCFSTLIPCVNIQNVTHVERSGIPEPTIESELYEDIYYPLALVNSRLLEWYYSTNLSDELSVVPDHIKDLPIAKISDISNSRKNDSYHEISNKIDEFVEEGVNNEIVDRCAEEIDDGNESVVHDAISDLARMLTKYYQRYEQLNTSFDEYLGAYSETEKLSNIGLCQPANTQKDDIIRETTKEKDGLQSNDARVKRLSANSVEIQLRARFKPENQNSNELDQWGYTKTDYIPAIQILDVSEIQADLIEAFVPMAVEKGEGYANYRGNATKTISLIDRLMDIRLPIPRDVETGLNNYLKVRDERIKLDQYITRADDLVNLLIYELYHLNQEEIEIIESAVSD